MRSRRARKPSGAALLLAVAIPCAAGAAPGGPVGPVVRVGTIASPAGLPTPTVAAAAFTDGGFVVVWNGPDTLRARLLDRNGIATGGEIQLARPAGQLVDAVAALPGGFVVVWEQANRYQVSSVFARLFDRSGAPLGQPFKVHGNSQYGRCCALAAAAPGGGFAVSWSAAAGTDSPPHPDPGFTDAILSRFFDARGRPLGPAPKDPKLGPAPYGILDWFSASAVAASPDGVLTDVIVDAGDQVDLFWSRSDQAGAGAGGGAISPSDADGADGYYVNLGNAGVGVLPEGGFIVSWVSNLYYCLPSSPPCTSSVFAQRFNGAGAPLGEPIEVSEHGYALVPWPALQPVGVLPDGGFIAIWNAVSAAPAPPGSGDAGLLFGRAFNADGTPKSAEFRVSTGSAGNERAGAIAVAPGGDALAVWSQPVAGATSVFARLLRP